MIGITSVAVRGDDPDQRCRSTAADDGTWNLIRDRRRSSELSQPAFVSVWSATSPTYCFPFWRRHERYRQSSSPSRLTASKGTRMRHIDRVAKTREGWRRVLSEGIGSTNRPSTSLRRVCGPAISRWCRRWRLHQQRGAGGGCPHRSTANGFY